MEAGLAADIVPGWNGRVVVVSVIAHLTRRPGVADLPAAHTTDRGGSHEVDLGWAHGTESSGGEVTRVVPWLLTARCVALNARRRAESFV
jgi:hypothetical protein